MQRSANINEGYFMKFFCTGSVVLMILFSTLFIGACDNSLKIRLNEDVARSRMRAIREAQKSYKQTKGNGKYGSLQDLIEAGLLNKGANGGHSKGYKFEIRVSENSYVVIAVPEIYGENGTGILSLYLDESGVIRGENKRGAEATKDDPPIGEKSD